MSFQDSNSIFFRSNNLLLGSIYSGLNFSQDKTFLYISSPFNDQWYNFMVPLVKPSDFNWKEAERIITEEKEQGRDVSYYIHSSLVADYESFLKELRYADGGDEVYMYKQLELSDSESAANLTVVDDSSLEDFVKMSNSCFPDWDNNEEYSRKCYNFDKAINTREFPSFILKDEGKASSFGALILSKELNLGYIHNTGTLEKYRRKGYFSSLIKSMCRYLLDRNISEVYAIVEEDSGSYHGFKKLGFDAVEKFYLYVKE